MLYVKKLSIIKIVETSMIINISKELRNDKSYQPKLVIPLHQFLRQKPDHISERKTNVIFAVLSPRILYTKFIVLLYFNFFSYLHTCFLKE